VLLPVPPCLIPLLPLPPCLLSEIRAIPQYGTPDKKTRREQDAGGWCSPRAALLASQPAASLLRGSARVHACRPRPGMFTSCTTPAAPRYPCRSCWHQQTTKYCASFDYLVVQMGRRATRANTVSRANSLCWKVLCWIAGTRPSRLTSHTYQDPSPKAARAQTHVLTAQAHSRHSRQSAMHPVVRSITRHVCTAQRSK
jgi:hypothetical protein